MLFTACLVGRPALQPIPKNIKNQPATATATVIQHNLLTTFAASHLCRPALQQLPKDQDLYKNAFITAFSLCPPSLQLAAKHENDTQIIWFTTFHVGRPVLQYIAKSQKSYQNDIIDSMSCGPTLLATHYQISKTRQQQPEPQPYNASCWQINSKTG